MAANLDVSTSPAWQRGLVTRWLVSAEHRRIGILYLATAGFFLVTAGVIALLMRVQLLGPDVGMVNERTYLGMTSFHGIAMLFFVALPIILGLANAIVPLMVGARVDAYPRVNTIAFWLFFFGGLCVALSTLAQRSSAEAGWTSYPPISLATGGTAQDLVLMGLILASVAALVTTVNLAQTVRTRSTAGMTWANVPTFARSVVIFAVGLVVAVPLTVTGCILLLLARRWPASVDFFVVQKAGVPVLRTGWVWLFGQPLVYLLLVPALGIVAEIASTFSRGRFRGGRVVAMSLAAFSALAVLTWLHHTTSVGAAHRPSTALLVLAVLTLVPIGAAIVAIASTGLGRREALDEAPAAFTAGALVLLALGALSAIFLAIWGNDRHLRGTAFVTGHAHYLLFGPALFALLGGLTYWWPKIFGRLLDRRLTLGAFALLFLGYVASFFLQFVIGDKGVARRVASYDAGGGVQTLEILASIFAFVAIAGAAMFLAAIATSRRARRAGNDPWRGDTLEWLVASPPEAGNFRTLPEIRSGRPLADLRRTLEDQGAL